MHATVEQLLSLRDKKPVDVSVSQHVAECDECCDALNQYGKLKQQLESLPQLDHNVQFASILERANAPVAKPKGEWFRLAVAATVVAALSLAAIPFLQNTDVETPTQIVSTDQRDAGVVAPPPLNDAEPKTIDQLRMQSERLEETLRRVSYGGNNTVMNARTAQTIVALEDRLALVDYTLTHRRLSQRQAYLLWQERVRLMDSLVRVRYAQVTNEY